MNDTAISLIRTYVPLAVGALVTWVAKHLGVHLDSVGLTATATVWVTAIYYSAVRVAEQKWPQAGWLLGAAKAPTYIDTTATVAPAPQGSPILGDPPASSLAGAPATPAVATPATPAPPGLGQVGPSSDELARAIKHSSVTAPHPKDTPT